MLFNEPKLLKSLHNCASRGLRAVSVLFNEPKLLKSGTPRVFVHQIAGFSALQRAEIAEIATVPPRRARKSGFSALQRAEIAEMELMLTAFQVPMCFSALQRAEIAEMPTKLLKKSFFCGFSALQRAEIAEIVQEVRFGLDYDLFQCSSTSRNC